MKTKIYVSKVTENNTCVWIETRYNEIGVNMGLFLVEEKNGKRIEDEEMPSMATAMSIYNKK